MTVDVDHRPTGLGVDYESRVVITCSCGWYAPVSMVVCDHCARPHGYDHFNAEDRVDPCLGVIPGVWVACCGHGGDRRADPEACLPYVGARTPGDLYPALRCLLDRMDAAGLLHERWIVFRHSHPGLVLSWYLSDGDIGYRDYPDILVEGPARLVRQALHAVAGVDA